MKKLLAISVIVLFVGTSVVPSNASFEKKHSFGESSRNEITDGLIGYWSFDEGDGSIAYDCSGFENDGTIYGASWTNGISGYALYFDGIDDWIRADPIFLDEHTINIWINIEDSFVADDLVLIENSDSNTVADYGVYIAYNNPLYGIWYFLRSSTGETVTIYSEENLMDINTWYMVTVSYDGSHAKIYLNGDLVVQENVAIDIRSEGILFGIGHDSPGGSRFDAFFNGIIDEICIYNRALNEDEIQYLYDNPGGVDVVYVDDDFNPSTPGWQIDHFDSIQDGVNAVVEGGTVYVYNGTYYENVVVDKTIDLVGEDKDNTIIDGGGSGKVVLLSADGVNISGFTIQNSGSGHPNSGIYISSNHTIISDNNVQNNYDGIYPYDSNNNTIMNNSVCSNNRRGINTDYSSHNIINMNNVENNSKTGIVLDVWSLNNTIYLNNIVNNGMYGGISIDDHSNNNLIVENVIANNNGYGVSIWTNSDNNIFVHNNFMNNTQNAYDEYTNFWYNATLQEGNYWSDYTGTDSNGDGIGDTPYDIPGGNQDLYPLGLFHPIANFTYSINDKTVQFDGSASHDPDGYITQYTFDFGDGDNETGMIVSHTYADYGTYNVTLTITDNDGKNDTISKDVTLEDTIPPEISGFQAVPTVQSPGGHVNISAQVTDNIGLSDVRLVIRYPDSYVENISILQNKTGDTYYSNRTYDMIGTYTRQIWAIDINSNSAYSALRLFVITEDFVASAGGPYYGEANVPLQFNGYAANGHPPYSWLWDFGDGNTSNIQNPIHTYTNAGNYTVMLTVTDDESNTADDATWALIEDVNHRPEKPTIDGQTNGKAGELYEYTFVTTDPDDDEICYFVDWGDDTSSGWSDFVESGAEITYKHTWSEKGTYTIKAKAKDVFDAESDWGELEVSMPRSHISIFSRIIQFLQHLIQRFPMLERILCMFPVFNRMSGLQ